MLGKSDRLLAVYDQAANQLLVSDTATWYSMNLSAGQGISVALTGRLNSGNLYSTLTDNEGNTLQEAVGDGQTAELEHTASATGDYYLKVAGSAAASGNYDIAVYNAWFNAGVTDSDRGYYATRSTADYLKSGNIILSLGETRWLRFSATAGSLLSFKLTGHLNDGSLSSYLTDSAGNSLQEALGTSDGQTAVLQHTASYSGVYYLMVVGSPSASGNFDLTASGVDADVDSDGDGVKDAAEYYRGTDVTKQDTDGDGVNDGSELLQGRDPKMSQAHSYPQARLAKATPSAAQAPSFTSASKISAGDGYSCTLTTMGGVKCWGYNSFGELGDNSTTSRSMPVDVTGLISGVTAIATGYDHACTLTTTGGVKCWGYNYYGQLGDNSRTNRLTPIDVMGLASGVTAISAGGGHTCVLTTAGGVNCWGDNQFGQLGDNSTTNRSMPVAVTGLASGVTAIAVGGTDTCALTTSGGVKCWGNNGSGQLGDNSTTNRLTPVDVKGLTRGVMAIATGGWHTCALTTAGGVKCWGSNYLGQLGDNSTTTRLTPVDVTGLASGVAAIAVATGGGDYTCALATTGGVKCWGYNYHGQLGDNSTTDRLTPVDVMGLVSAVAAISSGYGHTCALTTSGGVKCWGYNDYGQLGDNTIIQRLTPVDVTGFTGGTVASGGTASSATPTAARLDVPQDFTITGTNLTTGMAFTIEDCEPESGPGAIPEIGTGTATKRTFRCVPRLPGPKKLTFKNAPGGNVLFTTNVTIDHPARLGNAATRGIPTVNAVSLWNGNVHLEATDLAVPGKGVSFALTRSYNSYSWDHEAARGSVSNTAPWRFNWDLQLGYVAGTGNKQIWVQREDGSGENFFKDTDGKWYPMDQGNFNLIKGDTPKAGQTTLLTREGLKYIFQNPDLGGKLIGIVDHDNNGLSITRNSSGRVGTVTDASNRAYTFSYDGNGNLSRVADFSGRYVEYTWETGASGTRLKTVRDVRNQITTYNYTLKTSTLAKNKPTDQTLLTSIVDPRDNTARTFTYTDTVYGNWGADSVKDALNNTWKFTYCAKQADGSCSTDPTAAKSFQTDTTPPLGKATIARFDTGGRLVEQVDANAKLSKTTPMPLTGLDSKNYNLAALPTQEQSALGVTGNYGTRYEYTPDKAGNLATQTDAEAAKTLRTWLGSSALVSKNLQRVSKFTSATGADHGFAYTNSGNVQTYTPPSLPAIALAYDAAGQVTAVTDGRKNTSRREYDTHGNLIKAIDPDTSFEQNSYDSLGRVLTTTDKRKHVTTNTWDAAGNLLSVTDALNGRVAYLYDANGNRSKMTDALGNVTFYTYDADNRLKTVGKVIGTQTLTTTYNYDALGRVISTVNANSHADSTTYDGEGNVLTQANALAYTTHYEYDADNRVIKTTDPENRVTETGYDKVGRVKTVKTAAGTTRYDYDGDGRMTRSTDPRGKATQYAYDAAGRLITLTDANSQVTRATYDANGNMLTVVDPGKHTTSYTYDKLNRPLTRTDANGQQWSTSYDENGNVETSTVPGNKTTTYSYDELDRVSRIDYPDASVVTYSYDANGNRLTMTDSTGTTSYTYDALDRMDSMTDPQGKTLSYSYDGIGNVVTLGYPGGQDVSYNYDTGERLVSLTDWLGNTTAYTLNKAGQVTTALFGNNSSADRVYDAAGRLTSLINKKADGSVISSHDMTLDRNGNITKAVTQLPLEPSLPKVNRSFTYDKANRLATYSGSAVSHDDAGRIIGLAGAKYSYNDRDQVTRITGSQSASHAYNGEGHRVMRNINGKITRFVIDPNRGLPEVLAETNNAGAVQRNYIYGYGLVEQIDSADAVRYYHYDPTGSTLALTNASGAVSDSYAYTPYGETTASGSTVNPFRYVGEQGVMDDGNGMQYMRARYYRPDVARFMSLDALPGSADMPQSLNRYAYVMGNPVMGVDPSGMVQQRRNQNAGKQHYIAGVDYAMYKNNKRNISKKKKEQGYKPQVYANQFGGTTVSMPFEELTSKVNFGGAEVAYSPSGGGI